MNLISTELKMRKFKGQHNSWKRLRPGIQVTLRVSPLVQFYTLKRNRSFIKMAAEFLPPSVVISDPKRFEEKLQIILKEGISHLHVISVQ